MGDAGAAALGTALLPLLWSGAWSTALRRCPWWANSSCCAAAGRPEPCAYVAFRGPAARERPYAERPAGPILALYRFLHA